MTKLVKVDYNVYSYTSGSGRPRKLLADKELRYSIITSDNILEIFTDLNRTHPKYIDFMKFLLDGCVGIVIYTKDEWISYGWIAPPSSKYPTHIKSTRFNFENNWWIFYCRTAIRYQNKGYYSLVLRKLIDIAQPSDNTPFKVFIDTDSNNAASNRAILKNGFSQLCTISVLKLYIHKWAIYNRYRMKYAEDFDG